jgi:hypothetical protein
MPMPYLKATSSQEDDAARNVMRFIPNAQGRPQAAEAQHSSHSRNLGLHESHEQLNSRNTRQVVPETHNLGTLPKIISAVDSQKHQAK